LRGVGEGRTGGEMSNFNAYDIQLFIREEGSRVVVRTGYLISSQF
jgi:hypothetical protein